jgi:hypothetical protein
MAGKPRKRGTSRRKSAGAEVKGKGKPTAAPKKKRHQPSSSARPKALAKVKEAQPPTVSEVLQTVGGPPYNDSLRTVARLLYISGAATIPMIAKELNVAEGTVGWWSNKDDWGKLKREVQRFASKESVRRVRRAMGRHVKKMDAELSTIVEDMNVLLTGGTLKPVATQSGAMRLKMEAIRLKIALYRAITYGSQGRSMAPHPSTVIFDGTDEDITGMLSNTRIEELLDEIPPYMEKAIEMVQGLSSAESLTPEVIDAITVILDKVTPEKDRPKHWVNKDEDEDDDSVLDAEEDDIEFGFDDDIDTDDAEETPKKEESNEQEQDPS